MASAKSKLLHSIGAVLFRYIYKNPKRNMLRLVKQEICGKYVS